MDEKLIPIKKVEDVKGRIITIYKPVPLEEISKGEENFSYFEQQAIMNGETSPQDIIIERNKNKGKIQTKK